MRRKLFLILAFATLSLASCEVANESSTTNKGSTDGESSVVASESSTSNKDSTGGESSVSLLDKIIADGLTSDMLQSYKEAYSFSSIRDEIVDKTLEGTPIPVQRSVGFKEGAISNDAIYRRNFTNNGASYDTVEDANKDTHIYTDRSMVEELESQLYTDTKDGVTDSNGPVYIPTLALNNKIRYDVSDDYSSYEESHFQNAFSFLPESISSDYISDYEGDYVLFTLFDSSQETLDDSPFKEFIYRLANQTTDLYDFDNVYNLNTVSLKTDGTSFEFVYSMEGIMSEEYDYPYYTKLIIDTKKSGDDALNDIPLPKAKTGEEDERLKTAFEKVNTKNYTLDIVSNSISIPAGSDQVDVSETLSHTRILSTDAGQIRYTYDGDNKLSSVEGFLVENGKKKNFIGATINGELNFFKNGDLTDLSDSDYQKAYEISPLFFNYQSAQGVYIFDNSTSLTESDLNLGYVSTTPVRDLTINARWDTSFGVKNNLLSLNFSNTLSNYSGYYNSSYVLSSFDVTKLPEINIQDNTDNIPWETILGSNYSGITADLGISYNLDDQITSNIDFKDYPLLPFFGQGYLEWDYYSFEGNVYLSSDLKEGDDINTLISNYQKRLTTENYFVEDGTVDIGDTIKGIKRYTKTIEDEDTGDTIKFHVDVYPSHSTPKSIFIRLTADITPAE